MNITELFSKISNPQRKRIIEALARYKELSFSELMEITEIKEKGTFGFHLKNLEGLVISKNGKYILSKDGKIAFKLLKEGEKLLEKSEKKIKFLTDLKLVVFNPSLAFQRIQGTKYVFLILFLIILLRYFSNPSIILIFQYLFYWFWVSFFSHLGSYLFKRKGDFFEFLLISGFCFVPGVFSSLISLFIPGFAVSPLHIITNFIYPLNLGPILLTTVNLFSLVFVLWMDGLLILAISNYYRLTIGKSVLVTVITITLFSTTSYYFYLSESSSLISVLFR